MKRAVATSLFVLFVLFTWAQTQPIDKPTKGYRFQYRIKGPRYKKSKVLEIMVDKFGNYLVATFRGEKSSFVYLYVYNLYTWDEKYKIQLDDNRCELYNSTFDESGEYFYVNYDIYRNKFKRIDLKTGEIEKVDCSETPNGCQKIEPQIYKVDGYTVGDNYYIYRDEKYENYIRVLVKKEMYIPKDGELDSGADFLFDEPGLNPEKGGTIAFGPADIKELNAGNEIEKGGIPIFFDTNAIDADGNKIQYMPAEGEPYKIRLTQVEINKLNKKISFVYDKFVFKPDWDAFEQEEKN